MSRDFRFGVTLHPVTSERREWVDEVKRVEAHGYSVVTVTDHFSSSGGIFAALATAHEAAPSLRVGTLVLNNEIWNPAVLAREVITCDVMTDGRFELGIGAGWHEADYRAVGRPRPPAAERIARLGEAIEIFERAFAGGPGRFEGRHYALESEGWPRPKQDRIPLVVGGGSRRILELAARKADIVSLHRNLEHGVAASWEAEAEVRRKQADPVAERVGWIRSAAGERFERLRLHALISTVVVTDRRRDAVEDLARQTGFEAADILDSPHFLIGTVDEMVAELEERRSRWGISYWTLVGGKAVEDFAPVAAKLAGT